MTTIEWAPWKLDSQSGPTYYVGLNKPVAVIVHRMQGYRSTARQWALGNRNGDDDA